jgi:hypothetical protein
MLDDIGAFDEIYDPIYYEDVDLGMRAQWLGYQCLYVPTAVVLHKVSATMKANPGNYIFLNQRNIEYLLLINLPFQIYVRYLPFRALLFAAVLMIYTFRGHGLAILKAKLHFLGNLKIVLRKRSALKDRRRVSPRQFSRILAKGWFLYKVRSSFQDII